MKEPIEYLGNVNSLTTREELYKIGKQMQIDAWNEAILNDAERAKNFVIFYNCNDPIISGNAIEAAILKQLKQ